MQTQPRPAAARRRRARIAEAFRRMANGIGNKLAFARTVKFYRSSGHEWTRQLG